MDKPFTLVVGEIEKELIEIINKSGVPIFCLKIIIEKIYNQLNEIESDEIMKYQKAKNTKKESDK